MSTTASPPSASSRRRQVRRVLLITLGLNLLVVGIKGGLGLWIGSLSLLADALHSITDGANNILGLVTNQMASPQPDRDHPYGHQKFEALGALGIAALLAIACYEILRSAVVRLDTAAAPVTMDGISLWLLLLVLGVNIFVAFYERRVGQRLDSPLLIADAHHTMGDVWITIAVLGGLVGVWLGWNWLDVALAFPVAVLVFHSGWQVLSNNLPWLVDRMAVAPEEIHQQVMQVPGVVNCHSIASRGRLGQRVFVDMHLVVTATDIQMAHDITETVEAKLAKAYGPVRATIHLEPSDYISDQISY